MSDFSPDFLGLTSTNQRVKGLLKDNAYADPEGGMGSGPPLKKTQKKLGFLSKTGQDPLKNHKATKPAFNVGPSSARQ